MLHRLAVLVGVALAPLVTASLILTGTAVATGCFGTQGANPLSAPAGAPDSPFSLSSAGGDKLDGGSEDSKSYDDTGVAAPPINLPAPVTGRLTTTTPDAKMASLMIGDELSVPANAMVMAVNDSKASASLDSDWKVGFNLNRLAALVIPSAHAADFPDVCQLPYHACGQAGPDGAFEFPLLGEIGDAVSIGVIDALTGEWVSAQAKRVIPPNVRVLPRKVTQVAFAMKDPDLKPTLYSFMPSAGADPKGQVEIHDVATKTSVIVPFVGPSPSRVDINVGALRAAIVDTTEDFVAVADLLAANFGTAPKVSLANATDVAFSNNGTRMAVTANPDVAVKRIMEIYDVASLASVHTITRLDLPTPIPASAVVVETDAIDHAYFFTTAWIDVYAFVGIYKHSGSGPDPRPQFGFVSDDIAGYHLIGMAPLPDGCLPRDIVFTPETDVLIACGGINQILRSTLVFNWPGFPAVIISPPAPVTDPGNLIVEPLHLASDGRVDGKVVGEGYKHVYATVRDGNSTRPDGVLTLKSSDGYQPSKRNDVGLVPTGLAVPSQGQQVFISTDRSHAVTTWDFDDLK